MSSREASEEEGAETCKRGARMRATPPLLGGSSQLPAVGSLQEGLGCGRGKEPLDGIG